jgi:pyrophosphatase PpaX
LVLCGSKGTLACVRKYYIKVMKYKAIIFDLDGTLLDSVATIVTVTRSTLESLGINLDDATMRNAIGVPLAVQAKWFAPGQEQDFMNRYRTAYIEQGGHTSKPFPGTKEMLTTLRSRGCATGIVTSKNAKGTNRAIEMSNMGHLFDCVVTADDVTQHKPDPAPVCKAMTLLQVTADQSLYVGDSIFDVQMAQRAGMAMVGVSWGARSREELMTNGSNGVVDNWDQFLKLVDG